MSGQCWVLWLIIIFSGIVDALPQAISSSISKSLHADSINSIPVRNDACPWHNGSYVTSHNGKSLFQIECYLDRYGANLGDPIQVNGGGFTKCLSECDKQPECNGIAYAGDGDIEFCYLKAELYEPVPDSRIWGAIKKRPAIPQPHVRISVPSDLSVVPTVVSGQSPTTGPSSVSLESNVQGLASAIPLSLTGHDFPAAPGPVMISSIPPVINTTAETQHPTASEVTNVTRAESSHGSEDPVFTSVASATLSMEDALTHTTRLRIQSKPYIEHNVSSAVHRTKALHSSHSLSSRTRSNDKSSAAALPTQRLSGLFGTETRPAIPSSSNAKVNATRIISVVKVPGSQGSQTVTRATSAGLPAFQTLKTVTKTVSIIIPMFEKPDTVTRTISDSVPMSQVPETVTRTISVDVPLSQACQTVARIISEPETYPQERSVETVVVTRTTTQTASPERQDIVPESSIQTLSAATETWPVFATTTVASSWTVITSVAMTGQITSSDTLLRSSRVTELSPASSCSSSSSTSSRPSNVHTSVPSSTSSSRLKSTASSRLKAPVTILCSLVTIVAVVFVLL